MARQYEVKGSGDKNIVIKVDGVDTANIVISSDIQAEDIFNSLDYHPRETYELIDGGADGVPNKSYEAFRDFLQSVIDGVNSVNVSTTERAESDEEPMDGAVAQTDTTTDDVYDEDIPF